MKKTPFTLGIACLAILASCKKDLREEAPETEVVQETAIDQMFQPQTTLKYVPNELLVKFKKGTSANSRSNALARIGGSVQEQVVTNAMRQAGDNEGFAVVRTSLETMEAISRMKRTTEIEYAEPNWIYTYGATSNDTYYTNGSLWGMYGNATSPANQYGSQAGEAWAVGKTGSSSTVYVGIIDEGVMHSHEDLAVNIWNNPFDPVGDADGDGRADDDGNGYVDDIRGWDFANNDNSTYDGSGDDHGTHVAGTIGAKGGNGKGVAGVCWDVKLITGKFLGPNGGTTANAIKAVDYFTDLKTRHGLNIVATNNSWGGGGYSTDLYNAIERANAAGILFIAAAGNDGRNLDGGSPSYPASYTNSNIIAVAAITTSGGIASWSNYGATSVDLGAPGSGIYSTLPSKSGKSSAYGSYSGTSMATPHVTGAAALYKSVNTNATAAEVKKYLLESTVSTGSLSGKCLTGGRLDAHSAWQKIDNNSGTY